MLLYLKYIDRYKISAAIAVVCVALEALCDLMAPTLMAKLIDIGIQKNDMQAVVYWGSLMVGVTVLGAVFAVIRSILSSTVSQRIGADLRYDMFSKIMRFSELSADKIQSGSLITRMTNDTNQVTQFINGMMRIFIKAPIICIGSIVLASMLNPKLSLVVYLAVILVTLTMLVSMQFSYRLFAKVQKSMDRVNAVVQEYLMGVRLIKAFGTYDEETARFEEANDNLARCAQGAQMVFAIAGPLIMLIFGLSTAAVIYFGSILFVEHSINTGDIAAFMVYMAQMLMSLFMIVNIFNVFVRTKASTERINEVLDSTEDFVNNAEDGQLAGRIDFENVSFSYPNGSGVPVLHNLSFSVAAGETLAIIGPTGSGKTTIAWLLLRFYDVSSGRILIDGQDIKSLDVGSLRRHIGIVPQNPTLFSGSVADNIRWGDDTAVGEELTMVVEKAQAEFVHSMPDGVDSLLNSGAVNVSGGQKQRISLARGLLKKSEILILDDATSALDAITEAKIRTKLNEMKNLTVINITQRCSTAMFADKILVLENGELAGFGTHAELLKDCAIYREIYKSQIEGNRVQV